MSSVQDLNLLKQQAINYVVPDLWQLTDAKHLPAEWSLSKVCFVLVLQETDQRAHQVCVYFLINKLEIQGVFQNIKHLCNIRALQIGAFV